MDRWEVFKQWGEIWKVPRLRYGAVIPLLVITTTLGIGVWSSGNPIMGIAVALMPFLTLVMWTLVFWWADWLFDE